MVTQHSMPSSPESSIPPHPLNTPEFIDRLAVELRSQGDVDLPHSYYVEQVKLHLAGKTKPETRSTSERPQTRYESSDCFRAWALNE